MLIPFVAPPEAPFIVMQAQAGAEALSVLLDSGAAAPFEVVLSPAAAARVGAHIEAGSATAQGVSGAQVAVARTTLPRFSLGPIKIENAAAAVLPTLDQISAKVGMPVDALIGGAFLRGRIVSINYDLRQVNLSANPPSRAAEPAPLAPRRPVMLVRAKVNGEGPFVFALDTGASHTLVSSQVKVRAKLETRTHAEVVGAAGAITAAVAPGRIDFAGRSRDVTLVVSDTVNQLGAAAGAPLDGILGADVFGHGVLTLDYANGRVWLQNGSRRP